MSVCYGRGEPLVFSGAATGDVYIWKEPLLLKRVKGHDGPVFAMFSLDKVCVNLSFPLSLYFCSKGLTDTFSFLISSSSPLSVSSKAGFKNISVVFFFTQFNLLV